MTAKWTIQLIDLNCQWLGFAVRDSGSIYDPPKRSFYVEVKDFKRNIWPGSGLTDENYRDYGMDGKFWSGWRDWRTLLGTLKECIVRLAAVVTFIYRTYKQLYLFSYVIFVTALWKYIFVVNAGESVFEIMMITDGQRIFKAIVWSVHTYHKWELFRIHVLYISKSFRHEHFSDPARVVSLQSCCLAH